MIDEIGRGILLLFAGIHFAFFLLYIFISFITRAQEKIENKINFSYSLFNFTFFLVIILKKVLFTDIVPITISTTYFLVCSSAYFGYLFFRMNRYKIIILPIFGLNSLLWLPGIFFSLAHRLFYLSAALLAFLYIILLTLIAIRDRVKDKAYIISLIGFISIYVAFIAEGVVQGLGTKLPILISSTYTALIVICYSLYFSYTMYKKNRKLSESNEVYEKVNKELQMANQIIEKQKEAKEKELYERIQQIDEMNVDKYDLKPKVREALLYTLQGLTDEKIAKKMDRSESMVKKYLIIAKEVISEKEGYELKSKNDLMLHFRKLSG